VVEDDEILRGLIARVLRSTGYRVLEAADCERAFCICSREEHIDLVLSDLVLPRGGGRRLLDELSRLSPGPRLVCMSGYPDGAERDGLSMPDGISAFLQKPFAMGALLETVRAVLESTEP
jgi:DNA-binding NtrC family response regulator